MVDTLNQSQVTSSKITLTGLVCCDGPVVSSWCRFTHFIYELLNDSDGAGHKENGQERDDVLVK